MDLIALVQQLVTDYQRTTRHHQLRVETLTSELVGRWDTARLERVLANLLSNAIKYSPDGGDITIKLTAETSGEGASWAAVVVQDSGLGIPAADLPHIFERFHRGTNVSGRIRGAGIGLAGARQLVEQHGGTIEVASVEGRGASFTVRLPCTPGAACGA
jgi:signal transduction histidine kinase